MTKNSKKDKKKEKKEKSQAPLNKRITLSIMGTFFIFFLLTIIGLVIFTYQLLYRSDYFLIKKNRIDWVKRPLAKTPYEKFLDVGMGQNIFKFDILSAADGALNVHPELKKIWIVRDFPDRLTFKIEPRVAIAQVGEKSFFLIDEEGVILTRPRDSILEDLPMITGIGWKFRRKVGQKEGSTRMARALLLLKTMDESDFSHRHTLTNIDVSDYRNISFFIEDGLEIKIGHSNFKERLESLDRMLASIKVDRDEVKYIDLRFDDAVLGTK